MQALQAARPSSGLLGSRGSSMRGTSVTTVAATQRLAAPAARSSLVVEGE